LAAVALGSCAPDVIAGSPPCISQVVSGAVIAMICATAASVRRRGIGLYQEYNGLAKNWVGQGPL